MTSAATSQSVTTDSEIGAKGSDTKRLTTRGTPYEFVPMSYKESFVKWWNAPSAQDAEKTVLSSLPFFPTADATRSAKVQDVDIGGGLHVNEFEITNTQKSVKTTNVVVLHGYGAGMAFFIKNFDAWSSIRGSKTYALDLLGFGRSSRPKFAIKTKDVTDKDDHGNYKVVTETEDWFIDSLERWRNAKKLDKFTLVGHSMGGYLAAVYAMKHPERVEKLVLLSPAGVERGYTEELDNTSLFGGHGAVAKDRKHQIDAASVDAPRLEEELALSQAETTLPHDLERSLTNELSTTTREMNKKLAYLWNRHISPFSFLRATSFLTNRVISQWTYRRFGDLPLEQRENMHAYVYKIFTGKPSGEYAITRLLAPGAVARMPLVDRVAKAGGLQCPSLWIYGENDWMNFHAGEEAVERLKRHTGRPEMAASHLVVPRAGHHVYLDNPDIVDRNMVKFLNS